MRYIADSNNYLQEVSFGADIMCNDKTCTEYTGAVPSGYSSLVDWFCQEGDKLYRWKVVSGQLTLDSSVPVKSAPGEMFAPAGYGLGELNGMVVTDCNTATANGFYTLSGAGLQNGAGGSLNYGNMLVLNRYSNNHITQIAYYKNNIAMRYYYNSAWSAWEPTGTSTGTGTSMELLWENASMTSSFDEQTISLDLSSYQFVLIYFNTYIRSATYTDYYNSTIAKVGQAGVQSDNGETGSLMTNRGFVVNTTGIEFKTAYYAKSYGTSSLAWSTNCLVPYQIYGIKGVS